MREMAKERLPKWLFAFVDRGTEDEVALRNNRAAFERIKLKTRVLTDVSKRNQEIELFGKKHGMPLGIAPRGPAGMLWYQGELELARAAKAANIPFTLATGLQTSMEDVAKLVGGTLWFQLYMWSDVRMSHILVERAKNAGFEALVVTVDGPVGTNREYNVRNGYGRTQDEERFARVDRSQDPARHVVVNPLVPVKSIRELIALAKAKPGIREYIENITSRHWRRAEHRIAYAF